MMCRRASRVDSARRAPVAFTLVELLVVIGIIAILIGILLPTIIAARRHANIVRCSANLRMLAHGCFLHAQEHRNYLPLAGLLQLDTQTTWGSEFIAAGLGDAERKRYKYATASGAAHIVTPLPASIAPYLSMQKMAFDDWGKLDQQLNDNRSVWQMFMCPETDAMERHRLNSNPGDMTPVGQGAMLCVAIGMPTPTYLWATNSDFGFNEGVLGFDYRPKHATRRLAGKQGRIARAAETMLMCDAINGAKVDALLPMNFQFPWITFAPELTGSGPVTLADVLAGKPNVQRDRAQFDKRRHRGRMNVVFADGHVETVNITPGDLERIFLLSK